MAAHITIHPAEGTWVVRADGAVIAESRNALELTEGSYPPVIYFPPGDVAMAFLEPSDRVTTARTRATPSITTSPPPAAASATRPGATAPRGQGWRPLPNISPSIPIW